VAVFHRPPEGGTPAETEDDFMFQLTPEEFSGLTSQNAISKAGRGGRRTPASASVGFQQAGGWEKMERFVFDLSCASYIEVE